MTQFCDAQVIMKNVVYTCEHKVDHDVAIPHCNVSIDLTWFGPYDGPNRMVRRMEGDINSSVRQLDLFGDDLEPSSDVLALARQLTRLGWQRTAGT